MGGFTSAGDTVIREPLKVEKIAATVVNWQLTFWPPLPMLMICLNGAHFHLISPKF